METHVWHAKRFEIVDQWGFKVPLRSRDKACRTVYRLSQRDGACLVDQSYMRTLVVQGNQQCIKVKELLQLREEFFNLQRRLLLD